MSKHNRFSARASLAAMGVRMRQLGIWQVIERQVQIEQKVIKHTPLNKVLDALINILAGGQGLVEVNTRVRPDEGVQRAFARDDCADQSTISETFNHCTDETTEQMQQALQTIYQTHSQGYQVLDVDMTGMPAGRQGEGMTKRNKRSFAAQEMLVLLAQLAYNLIAWTRDLLAEPANTLRKFGVLRMVRDAFHILGRMDLDAQGRLLQIVLCAKHPLAWSFALGLAPLLARDDLSLNLGQI